MIPTRFTLPWRKLIEGAVDAHGNAVDAWGDPVDWPVHGYGPGANELANTTNRDLSMIQWTVYAPAAGPTPRERDKVIVDGAEFVVHGRAEDWSRGPWHHGDAGVVVMLEDTEG